MLDGLPVLGVDFETLSAAELRDVGGRNYLRHPSARMLCAVGAWEGCGTTRHGMLGVRIAPGQVGCPFPLPADGKFIALAHNARTFDRHVWSMLGWPEPVRWVDTAEYARRAGYGRASLGALLAETGAVKDYKGLEVVLEIQQCYKAAWELAERQPRLPGLGMDDVPMVLHERTYTRALDYCERDVVGLMRLFERLKAWDPVDRKALEADCAVQDRGVAFDCELAAALLATDQRLALEACKQAKTWPEIVRSRELFMAQLMVLGVDVPDAQRKTLQEALKGLEDDDPAALFIRARLAGTTIASGKLRAGLARCCPDGRQRDTTMYYAAGPGRFAGKGIQVQNLSGGDSIPAIQQWMIANGIPLDKPELVPQDVQDQLTEELRDQLVAGEVVDLTSKQINTMLRACFLASEGNFLHVSDFSGIENRVLAWAAGDEVALANQRSGADVYRLLAAEIFRRPAESFGKSSMERKAGKIGELGLGYQMGKRKFRKHLLANGIDPVALERDFGVSSDEVVDKWRELHWPIPLLWQAADDGMMRAVKDKTNVTVGPVEYRWKAGQVACVLPTGRPIVYRRVAIVRWGLSGRNLTARMPDGSWLSFPLEDDDGRTGGPGVVYYGRDGWMPLYGGLLVENFVQGTAREILVYSLGLCEQQQLNPVMHVHDSIVTDNDLTDGLIRLKANMHEDAMPRCFAGIPIRCEGFTARRYA